MQRGTEHKQMTTVNVMKSTVYVAKKAVLVAIFACGYMESSRRSSLNGHFLTRFIVAGVLKSKCDGSGFVMVSIVF